MIAKKIKLIYCYMVCFFAVFIMVFNLGSTTSTIISLFMPDENYVPYELEEHNFMHKGKEMGLSHEKLETLRQIKIKEARAHLIIKNKRSIIDGVVYLLYNTLALLLHIFLIRRTREDD
jgi:hypothetical protein